MSQPKKGLIQEFKDFIATGDLMTFAIAFIMGAAISAVITSFVKNIALGLVGLFVKCKDIVNADNTITKNCGGLVGKGYKSVLWGDFLNDVVAFLILAVVVFAMFKAYSKLRPPKPETPEPTSTELLAEIRDDLRAARR